MPKNELQKRITELVKAHGSYRKAGAAVDIDPTYLLNLQRGAKTAPSDGTLEKLGLRRIETYVRVRE